SPNRQSLPRPPSPLPPLHAPVPPHPPPCRRVACGRLSTASSPPLGHADSPNRRSIPSSPACGPASPTAPVSALRSPIPRPVAAETPRSPRPYPVAQSSAWLRSLPASCHRCPPSSPSAALSPPVTPVPTGISLDAFPPRSAAACARSWSDLAAARSAPVLEIGAAPANPPPATRCHAPPQSLRFDEVAPIPIRLTTSHFDTRSRGCHIAAIGGGSVKSTVCHKQRRVPRLHDSARSELERRLHSNILSERSTNCANASRWPATRHQESIECVQGNQRIKIARV